jgi:methyl-accepting chemotaxis protein
MQVRIFTMSAALLLAAPAMQLAAQSNANSQPAQAPPGHGIKCLKADGKTPCGNPEVSDLNKDIADFKATFGDAKAAVGDTQQTVGDVKQTGSDAKQAGADTKQAAADAKHPVANAKQEASDAKQTGSDAKQVYGDAQQTYGDAQQTKSDAQSTAQDVQQNAQDIAQTAKDLKGIGSLALRALDGSMSCTQEGGSACTDNQTKALKTHAAQKKPPLTVKREADQASN